MKKRGLGVGSLGRGNSWQIWDKKMKSFRGQGGADDRSVSQREGSENGRKPGRGKCVC